MFERPLSRRDYGYTVVSRFEILLRLYIADYLTATRANYLEAIPEGIKAKVEDRTMQSDPSDPIDFLDETDMPDLKDILLFGTNFEQSFGNADLTSEQFISAMNAIYVLRCKIAHIRGYFTFYDLDSLMHFTKQIANCIGIYGAEFIDFIGNLNDNPQIYIVVTPTAFFTEETVSAPIPHNVPTGDYEFEGGFVGRAKDISRIRGLLASEVHRVITISGAGGVGKTALCLKVLTQILQTPNPLFDGIIWISAKESKLTYLGIEDLEPTVRSYEEFLDTIFEVLAYEPREESVAAKEAEIQQIFALRKTTLIVVDNLETVADERILNFILDTPNVKFLITSRRGLGQVERRFELSALSRKEAIQLFRLIARDKGVESLAKLDNAAIQGYVERLSNYPLAIKWAIGQFAIGKNLNNIFETIDSNTSDIARFCFEKIFADLSAECKRLLCVLSCFDDPPATGLLKYVADVDQIALEDSIKELVLLSLVVPEHFRAEDGEIQSRLLLLPLTRGYVRAALDDDVELRLKTEQKLGRIQEAVDTAARARSDYRYGARNLGANTEEEKLAVLMGQTAHQKYSAGSYSDALVDYKKAVEVAPRFPPLYRNWAMMESAEGHFVEANELLQRAAKLDRGDQQTWLIWGNVKRREGNNREAVTKYEEARKISPNDPVILGALGQAKMRLGEFEAAEELFKQAIEFGGDVGSRHIIINFTSRADNFRRWAERLFTDRSYRAREEKLLSALRESESAVKMDPNDGRAWRMFRRICIDLGFCFRRSNEELALQYFERAVVFKPERMVEIRDTMKASFEMAKIQFGNGKVESAKRLFIDRLKAFSHYRPTEREVEFKIRLERSLGL